MRKLGLLGLFGLGACTLPTTIGLRSAGDLAPAGQTGVGAGLSALTYEWQPIPGVNLDLDRSLSDKVGVAGGVGFFGTLGQAQAELRLSTPRAADWGAALLIGGAGLVDANTAMGGPYLGASGRRATHRGFAYAGMKAAPVFSGQIHQLWLHPTLGLQRRRGSQTFGVELTVPFVVPSAEDRDLGALAWIPMPGLQFWVRGAPFAER